MLSPAATRFEPGAVGAADLPASGKPHGAGHPSGRQPGGLTCRRLATYLWVMLNRVRDLYRKMTTRPCDACGKPVKVSEYRATGNERRQGWLSGVAVEMECPYCGETFWIRK